MNLKEKLGLHGNFLLSDPGFGGVSFVISGLNQIK